MQLSGEAYPNAAHPYTLCDEGIPSSVSKERTSGSSHVCPNWLIQHEPIPKDVAARNIFSKAHAQSIGAHHWVGSLETIINVGAW